MSSVLTFDQKTVHLELVARAAFFIFESSGQCIFEGFYISLLDHVAIWKGKYILITYSSDIMTSSTSLSRIGPLFNKQHHTLPSPALHNLWLLLVSTSLLAISNVHTTLTGQKLVLRSKQIASKQIANSCVIGSA